MQGFPARSAWVLAPSSLSSVSPVVHPRVCRPRPLISVGTRCLSPSRVPVTCAASSLRSRIPNILTWMRVAAVPVLSCVGLVPAFYGQKLALAACFIGASITDFADGYLARRWKTTSAFGAFLDPVADKLMVAAALVIVSIRFAQTTLAPFVAISAILILTREVFVSALREWMASAFTGGRDVVQVGFGGKVKTATQMCALSVLLAASESFSPLACFGTVLLAISAVLGLTSAAGYVQAALPAFARSAENLNKPGPDSS